MYFSLAAKANTAKLSSTDEKQEINFEWGWVLLKVIKYSVLPQQTD